MPKYYPTISKKQLLEYAILSCERFFSSGKPWQAYELNALRESSMVAKTRLFKDTHEQLTDIQKSRHAAGYMCLGEYLEHLIAIDKRDWKYRDYPAVDYEAEIITRHLTDLQFENLQIILSDLPEQHRHSVHVGISESEGESVYVRIQFKLLIAEIPLDA